MGADPWGFDEERQALARKLATARRRYGWAHTGILSVFLLVLLAGGAVALRDGVGSLALPSWAASTAFLAVLYAIGSALGWPFDYVGRYKLDRRYGLLTQGLRSWIADRAKSFALGLAAVVVAGDVLLWILAAQPTWWWLLAWALGLLVSLVLTFIAPVVIAPIFYKFRPVQDPALRARFEALATRAGVPVVGVFEMGASAKTRRTNAAVTGLGRTRRIVVTDTLLGGFTPEETVSVLAHELGHQRFSDLPTGVLVGAAFSLVMWSLGGGLYAVTYPALGIASLGDIAGLPLLLLWTGLVSTALGPLELWWSRRRESRADRFSLELTRNPGAFEAAMVRLTDSNLGLAHPHAWEKWLLFSHPPGQERIEAARGFKSRGPVAPP